MRPVASAGRRARTRAFSNSISLGLIEAIVGWALDADTLIVQKSSKPANVLSTGISRVSTASRPARVHNSRSTSIRDASRRGGLRTVSPIALISADCLKGSECRDAETGSFGIADVFGQQHSLRRRQHNIFGGRAVWPTPLSVPNPDPLADAIGDARTYPINIARSVAMGND